MSELANCLQCGKVFVKTLHSICSACQREVNQKFEIVYKYIRKRENRQATIYQVYEATGVEEKLIIQFVKEGRLRVLDYVNLTYPCEACGSPINKGTLCVPCQKEMGRELSVYEKQQSNLQNKEPGPLSGMRTYYTYDKGK